MNKKSVFKELITDFHQRKLDYIIDRDIEIPLQLDKVISIFGPRRAGKTSICLQTVRRLRCEIRVDRITYINFEDDRLYPLTLEEVGLFLSAYYELYPHNKDEKTFFFFDEVQEVKNWEKFIRRLIDQENCRIFITGSSSKLLSREIATSLRGRTYPVEVLPLSFKEFLRFNRIQIDQNSSKGKALMENAFYQYIKQGGYPELIFLDEVFHKKTIGDYIDIMIYRDLVERFGIRTPSLLKYLLKYSMNNLATLLSVNKLYNDLKSQGYSISKNTVYEYLSYLEEAFALFRIQMWSRSERQRNINPDKIYTVDPAFKYVMSGFTDIDRVLENLVYLALRRIVKSPNYFKDNQEVDFYEEDQYLVNVCLDLSNPPTERREIKGLLEAMKSTGIHSSYIITLNQESIEKTSLGNIHIIKASDFLLHPEKFIS